MKFLARLAQALSWNRWLWTAAFSAVSVTWVFRTFFDLTVARVAGVLPWLLALGAIALVCVAFAEAIAAPGRVPPTWRYVAAIVVASVIAAALCAVFHEPLRTALAAAPGQVARAAPSAPPHVAPLAMAIFGGANVLILGLVVVLAHARLQHVRAAARALSEAEVAREEAQRRLTDSRLHAVHREVDPGAVISGLEEIERAYEADAARADEMLALLIEKLRAAIPRLRTARPDVATP